MESLSDTTGNKPELPILMETLEIDKIDEEDIIPNSSSDDPPKRTLRSAVRGTPKMTATPSSRKRTYSSAFDETNPERYYLSVNKKLKSTHINLETIFEEPLQKLDKVTFLGPRKLNRSLTFTNPVPKKDKIKSKKRVAKVKKHFPNKYKLRKVSDEQFKNKMDSLLEMLD